MNYCKCGCGAEVKKNWATGHHRRGASFNLSEEAKEKCRLAKLGSKNPRYGKPGTCLGRVVTDEQKQKIREARSRQQITDNHRKAISNGLKRAYSTGKRLVEENPFYIDGRNKGRKLIKKSFEYREWRRKVFERDNYTCQLCGVRGGEVQADHIWPQSAFPELRFELTNGRTLCRPCHTKTETWGMRHWANRENTSNLLQLLAGNQV